MISQVQSSLGRWAALTGVLVLLAICLALLGGQAVTAEVPEVPRPQPRQANITGQGDLALDAVPQFQSFEQISPGFTVDLAYDAVWGLVEPGATVTVERASDGAYGAAEANGKGFFWTPLWQANGQPAYITGGDAIHVFVDGDLEASIPVVEVSGGIDVLADQVDGAIPNGTVGTPVTVTIGLEGGQLSLLHHDARGQRVDSGRHLG